MVEIFAKDTPINGTWHSLRAAVTAPDSRTHLAKTGIVSAFPSAHIGRKSIHFICTVPLTSHGSNKAKGKIVNMPREVTDLKQFIEICRRKDAKCPSPFDNISSNGPPPRVYKSLSLSTVDARR